MINEVLDALRQEEKVETKNERKPVDSKDFSDSYKPA